jgi:TRAP-type C4-dicarboxylate transport system substrate-binding protein
VRAALAGEFAAGLKRRGYALLSWGDVGWIHIFTARRIASLREVKASKLWTWTDDPMARAYCRRFGAKCVLLGVQDVLPSLQTGLVDAFYGSPYMSLALQWHTKVKYISRQPVTYAVGAIVIRQSALAALPARSRQILVEESRAFGVRFTRQSRADNAAAMRQLKQLGLQEVPLPPDVMAHLRASAPPLWKELTGTMVPAALLARAIAVRDGLRKKK